MPSPRHLILILALVAQPAWAHGRVLAPGNPPLTDELLERSRKFVEWLVDAPMNEEQRAHYDAEMLKSWQRADADDIQTTVQFADTQKKLAGMTPAQRALIREKVGQPFWDGVRQAAATDPDAKWFLDLYDAAHLPIADGHPPLTRQAADAYLDLWCFFLHEGGGSCGDVARARPDLERLLAQGYGQLPATEQAEIAKSPLLLASVRIAWPTLSAKEKAKFLESLRGKSDGTTSAGKRDLAAQLEEIHSKHTFMLNMGAMIAHQPYRFY